MVASSTTVPWPSGVSGFVVVLPVSLDVLTGVVMDGVGVSWDAGGVDGAVAGVVVVLLPPAVISVTPD